MKLKNKTDVTVPKSGKRLFLHAADVRAVYTDSAAVSLVQCAHDLQQCGFPCTAWSYDTHNLSPVDGQVYTFQHLQTAETFGYTLHFYHFFLFVHFC